MEEDKKNNLKVSSTSNRAHRRRFLKIMNYKIMGTNVPTINPERTAKKLKQLKQTKHGK